MLLDNGRSQAFADGELRQTLNCIRCGACMNHCPVYTRIGGHAYGTVYPGPIGKIVTPHMLGLDATRDLPTASSMCGACGEVCPVKIPIPSLLRRLREEAVRAPDAAPQARARPGREVLQEGDDGLEGVAHAQHLACACTARRCTPAPACAA